MCIRDRRRVHGADKAATSFDEQIRDKKNLMQGLNDSLDSRIISINLLLSRAESMLDRASNAPKVQLPPVTDDRRMVSANDYPDEDVFDEQKSIVDLYEKGLTADDIASRLSMPKGEVALVISLKKKFVAMENP
eukprot:TRINITY_DN22322_c0_g1_i2.p3 TRINITY_DN22322_c0_g1~~TRINITY_DN22322_c0_g1_i2.p3  ORF type:complete len:134 (-),score=30.12 TRINITY_DN22322_c0_g1_i2:179-580(-)